ncbi:hypothetical protein AVEN_5984-1 [Araneus ventricosus]|uniref:Uncharacterized protein n=1 Tax=Araneus ventricosus TaxID=182803 RepID=A0A4Y2UVD8_ARAVE|nr:hypothetical protein AVEN_5984-1 [Araneus ventricosus]
MARGAVRHRGIKHRGTLVNVSANEHGVLAGALASASKRALSYADINIMSIGSSGVTAARASNGISVARQRVISWQRTARGCAAGAHHSLAAPSAYQLKA